MDNSIFEFQADSGAIGPVGSTAAQRLPDPLPFPEMPWTDAQRSGSLFEITYGIVFVATGGRITRWRDVELVSVAIINSAGVEVNRSALRTLDLTTTAPPTPCDISKLVSVSTAGLPSGNYEIRFSARWEGHQILGVASAIGGGGMLSMDGQQVWGEIFAPQYQPSPIGSAERRFGIFVT